MPTLNFDNIAVDFVARIPTQFKSAFDPNGGEAMPDTFVLPADQVINFVNRALQKFFNDYWTAVAGNTNKFIAMFPELAKMSASESLTNGDYTIDSPQLDFYKLISAQLVSGEVFIKQWDPDKFHIALTGEYDEYTATAEDPAIIQIGNKLSVFPRDTTGNIKFLYIKYPVGPLAGLFLEQNSSVDSPFYPHWNKQIADIAYLMFLQETNQTT